MKPGHSDEPLSLSSTGENFLVLGTPSQVPLLPGRWIFQEIIGVAVHLETNVNISFSVISGGWR